MDPKDRIGMTLGFVVLIGIGIWAVLDPSAMEGYEAIGRRAGLKQLVAGFWGRRLGVAMIAMGALAIVGLRSTMDD